MKRRTPPPAGPRVRRGVTLLELVIALAVLAVLGALAAPQIGAMLTRQRLVTTAELLAADISDARYEAARRGAALHLQSAAGAQWCWAVATAPGCSCQGASACRIKTASANDHPGVSLVSAEDLRLDPDGQVDGSAAALFAAGNASVRVEVSRFGRTRICDPAGNLPKLPRC